MRTFSDVKKGKKHQREVRKKRADGGEKGMSALKWQGGIQVKEESHRIRGGK